MSPPKSRSTTASSSSSQQQQLPPYSLRIFSGPTRLKPPSRANNSGQAASSSGTTKSLRSVASLPSLRLWNPFSVKSQVDHQPPPPPVPALLSEEGIYRSASNSSSSQSSSDNESESFKQVNTGRSLQSRLTLSTPDPAADIATHDHQFGTNSPPSMSAAESPVTSRSISAPMLDISIAMPEATQSPDSSSSDRDTPTTTNTRGRSPPVDMDARISTTRESDAQGPTAIDISPDSSREGDQTISNNYATLVNPQPTLSHIDTPHRHRHHHHHQHHHHHHYHPEDAQQGDNQDVATASSAVAGTTSAAAARAGTKDAYPFSIKLTPFIDHSSTMPSLYIATVERQVNPNTVLKIGRYNDKRDDSDAVPLEMAPIVFKSKVVSRSHAEFLVDDTGAWFVRDVKSSSGTFLNHVRLAPACQESTLTKLTDGDQLQLGMDFRGGSEGIYKCVKMQVELNYSWRKKASNFNMSALANLRDFLSSKGDESELQECAICLLPVSPLQALFIAPCSHAWHYKCIRPIIIKSYPHFLCPNCRSVCDLEADVEVPDLSHLSLEGTSGS